MSATAIEVDALSKVYRIQPRRSTYKTVREETTRFFKSIVAGKKDSNNGGERSFWALREISFQVGTGEVLGIIGRNGAGKSTLLKILSRISEPTAGAARVRGKVGSLLDVGTGFHPELSGRENVYLSGAILGMTKQEIAKKFDEIISFAEIERFVDTPVKHYSSGMAMRLAFAVAASLDTDIILIDEILAVGDAGFQRKYTSMLRNSIKDGRTAIVVSHNMGLIRTLCSRVIVLETGRIYADGSLDEVIPLYHQLVLSGQGAYEADIERANRTLFVANVFMSDLRGNVAGEIPCGQSLRLNFVFRTSANTKFERMKVHLRIYSSDGDCICYVGNQMAGFELPPIENESRIICEIENPNLGPGDYFLGFMISDGQTIYDEVPSALTFAVSTGDYFGSGVLPRPVLGRILLKSRWWVEDKVELVSSGQESP